MKNFFIPEISPERKQKLQEAAVAFCDMELDGAIGLVVDEDNIDRALEVLGAAIESEKVTSIEGIVKIFLKEVGVVSSIAYTVTVKSWSDGGSQETFKKIVSEILSPFIKRNVEVYVPHKNCHSGVSVDNFGIFVWSAPQRIMQEIEIKNWGGKSLGCSDSLSTEDAFEFVVMDEAGVAIAGYRPGNLWIFNDLVHYLNDNDQVVLRKILEEVVINLSASSEEKAERQRKLAESKRVASREAYMKECSRRFEKTVQGTKDAVAKGHADIVKLQQELTKRIRETQGAERKLEQIEIFRAENTDSYGREFDSLLQVPGVENIETADGVIKVFTEHIYITPDGCADTYDIGKFRMEVYTAGSNGGIRFFNLTRRGTGSGYNTNHPHVKENGSPCLGNISEQIANLIGEYEYSAVAQIGLQYLQSVNTGDSAGGGIFDHWPKKEKKEEGE